MMHHAEPDFDCAQASDDEGGQDDDEGRDDD
jgi:hypothetical protein